jgi:nucleoside-diphosphate-sugar epimerase
MENAMDILVTGGAGDIGGYVVKELLAHDLNPTIVDIRKPFKRDRRITFIQCDLTDLGETISAVRGHDVVIHLAAIPHPYNDPLDRVIGVNTVACFNVLEAARRNDISRIVYGCSESSSGFGIHNVDLRPLYLPIDEAHPCWPHESYSLSKWFGEEIVANYARAYGIEGISLRYCWVWLERDAEAVRRIVGASSRGEINSKNWFGCYIAPHDVAQACRLAACYDFPADQEIPFEAFYLAAETTFLPMPTLEALAAHFDPLPEIRSPGYFESNPLAPPFDTRKARRLLGFRPTKHWQTYEQWEEKTQADTTRSSNPGPPARRRRPRSTPG